MARGGQFEMAGTSCSIFDRSFSFRFIMEFLGSGKLPGMWGYYSSWIFELYVLNTSSFSTHDV